MDLKSIRLFVILAEELHFNRAARRAGLSQSVLSVKIKRLEDEIGVALFRRSTREVTLTQAGSVFLAEAHGILRRVDEGRRAARAAAAGSGQTLRIGITWATELSEVMGRIATFRKFRPDIQVLIRELGTVDQEAALGMGDIDIGILHPPLDRTDLETTALARDPFLAVYHDGFFELGAEFSWNKLFHHPLIFYPRRRAPRLHDSFIGFAAGLGHQANIVSEAESFLSSVAMAHAGIGIALVPRQITQFLHGVQVKTLPDDSPLRLETAAAVRAGDRENAAIAACLGYLRPQARGDQPQTGPRTAPSESP